MFGVLLFEDNHTEDIIVYRPQSNGIHEFFTASGLYIYVEEAKTFYKYNPEYIVRYPSVSGGCDYSDTSCYFVAKTVAQVKLHFTGEDVYKC